VPDSKESRAAVLDKIREEFYAVSELLMEIDPETFTAIASVRARTLAIYRRLAETGSQTLIQRLAEINLYGVERLEEYTEFLLLEHHTKKAARKTKTLHVVRNRK